MGISGMTDPKNVIGFLDIFGDWKPALILVMGGAIGFHAISYYFIRKRPSPILADAFLVPRKSSLDVRLIAGSALFGVGWGIGGFCPGPAVASVATLNSGVFTFILAMLVGIAAYHYVFKPVFEKAN